MSSREASSANVAIERGVAEDIQRPAVKRNQTPRTTITIVDDDERNGIEDTVRDASPRLPWRPRGTPRIDARQETGSLQIKRQELPKAANKLQLFSISNAREEKNSEAYIAGLEQKVRDLESEVSKMSEDLRKREVLFEEAFHQQQQVNPQPDLAKSERRTLIVEREELRAQLEQNSRLIIAIESNLYIAKERCDQLVTQKVVLEKEYRKRGEEIIKLTRDVNSITKRASKTESRRTLLNRLGGMFAHYHELYEKNEALVQKLMNMAKAGGFGHPSSLYRREVEGLMGAKLESLEEYKRHLD
ncbi:hypothetical protein DE146DRAFT_754684 [Phaeosphaeria sp. MPI-PUGE-AT-0046c]|nr:hypothetical protein DE146DRAFT_754684 [Phaeosphaeria sp. MPI-PUGE-AT-0046c]